MMLRLLVLCVAEDLKCLKPLHSTVFSISGLVWEHLGIHQEGLEDIDGENDIWATLFSLLPLRLTWTDTWLRKWHSHMQSCFKSKRITLYSNYRAKLPNTIAKSGMLCTILPKHTVHNLIQKRGDPKWLWMELAWNIVIAGNRWLFWEHLEMW